MRRAEEWKLFGPAAKTTNRRRPSEKKNKIKNKERRKLYIDKYRPEPTGIIIVIIISLRPFCFGNGKREIGARALVRNND